MAEPPRVFGYYRVSTTDQNPQLQIDALRAAGCTDITGDIGVSGAKASRPAFDGILDTIGEEEKLIVWRLDRMGRSLRHLIEVKELLDARGASFESLNEKIDTSTAMGNFVFQILGAVAELEREIIRERTLAGMAVAAREGRFPGRPRNQCYLRTGQRKRSGVANPSILAK